MITGALPPSSEPHDPSQEAPAQGSRLCWAHRECDNQLHILSDCSMSGVTPASRETFEFHNNPISFLKMNTSLKVI